MSDSKKKIVHLTTSLNPGGVTTLIKVLIPPLKEAGYDNIIVTTLSQVPGTSHAPLNNVPIYFCPWIGRREITPSYRLNRLWRHSAKLTFIPRLGLLLFRLKPHIVQSHMHGGAWLSQLLATKAVGAHFIMTLHSPSSHYPWTWGARIFARLLTSRDRIIGDSDSLYPAYKKFLDSTNLKPPNHFIPMTPGVSDPGLKDPVLGQEIRKSLKIPQDNLVIGTLGRLVPEKRVRDLLKAVRMLPEDLGKIHVILVGDGEERSQLEKEFKTGHLANRLHFTGFQTDPCRWLNAMDIFTISSLFEGFGIATVESMAKGVPIIGSDVAYTNNLIRSGHNGLLYPPKDHEALARCLIDLCKAPEKRKSMGKCARQLYLKDHSADSCAKKHINLFESIL